MSFAESVSSGDRDVAQRARLRTVRQRRRRLGRRLVALATMTAVMVVVILLSRDAQHLRAIREQGQMIADVLQETYARRQDPPLSFPPLAPPDERLYERYEYNMFYADQSARSPCVGVCCLREREHFFVLTEGRVVILFDGEAYSSRWMSEREFRTQAGGLGFGSLLKE